MPPENMTVLYNNILSIALGIGLAILIKLFLYKENIIVE